MAEWSKNKVDPINLHGGQEFVKGDNLAVDELNAIVNNSFYASDKSTRAEQLAESAVKGNGTLVTIGGVIQGEWSADFVEEEKQKSKTDGAILHENTGTQLNNYIDAVSRGYGTFRGDISFSSWEDVQTWVQNEAPVGSYVKYANVSGMFYTLIIQKTSSQYGAIVRFTYESGALQKSRLYGGYWREWE